MFCDAKPAGLLSLIAAKNDAVPKPSTSPDPLNIPFQDPPANANARVLKSFNNWKQRLGVAKGVKENL